MKPKDIRELIKTFSEAMPDTVDPDLRTLYNHPAIIEYMSVALNAKKESATSFRQIIKDYEERHGHVTDPLSPNYIPSTPPKAEPVPEPPYVPTGPLSFYADRGLIVKYEITKQFASDSMINLRLYELLRADPHVDLYKYENVLGIKILETSKKQPPPIGFHDVHIGEEE